MTVAATLDRPLDLARRVRAPRAVGALIALAAAVGLPILLGRTSALGDEGRAADVCHAGILAIAGLSLNLLAGYAGQISLGQMSLVGVGAFVGGLAVTPLKGDVPFGLGLVIAAAAGAGVALLVGMPALRLRGLYLAVVTIAFAFVTDELVFGLGVFGGSAGLPVPRPYFGDTAVLRNADLAAIILGVLVLVLALDVNVTRSKVGRAFQAVRADEDVAAAFGVDPARWKLIAFTLSGAIAGLAGLLSASLTSTAGHRDYDYTASLNLVVVVVVGGLGSRVGVVAATTFFALLPHWLQPLLGGDDAAQWSFMIGAVLLIVTMATNPRGIAGAIRDAHDAQRARRDPAFTDIIQTLPDLPAVRDLRLRVAVRPDQPLLRVRDIGVSFGGLRAVDGVSFGVRPNTICGLVGPNGAGKSTLFSVVSGLRRPDQGTVTFAGRDITALLPAQRAQLGIGRTFQLIGLAKELSVTENLLLAQHVVLNYSTVEGLLNVGRAPAIERRARTRAAEAIATLRFERYADAPVKRLSHGQQRIVEIACALVTGPELVMLDEPAAGMSPAAREVLAERLRGIRDDLGRTVLLIEHDIPLVLEVADTVVVMDAGRALTGGAPKEVVTYPEVIDAYLGRGYEQALAR